MTDIRPAAGGQDLVLDRVTKRFGTFVAVNDLSVTVPQGSFFALLGPSGCGKTTTLRMVAGLEQPSEGSIRLGAQDISNLKPYRRPVNTVFQSYALFPHLTTFENVAFGLRRRGIKDVGEAVGEMLELVELQAHASKRPIQLSGGQQQRVALARALINRPQVLLLDEPLGALDLKLRRSMQIELKRIQTEVGITFVHVTHDQEEAMTMADTIAVMHDGVIEQMGHPGELYESPRTTFVSNFLGQSNLVAGRIVDSAGPDLVVEVQGTKVTGPSARAAVTAGDVWVGVRPEKITLTRPDERPDDGWDVLRAGIVSDVSFVGVSTQYLVRMPWGQELIAFKQNTGADSSLNHGDEVELRWRPEHTFFLDASEAPDAGVEHEDEV